MDDHSSVGLLLLSQVPLTNYDSIAILSGLLLGGNNPNTLEGVLALETLNTDDRFEPFKRIPILKYLPLRFELAYPSRYKIQ